jgi:hypothetical protein
MGAAKRFRAEHCPIKGHTRIYFPALDMFACKECDAWLSDRCGCPPSACEFAAQRVPRDPSMAKHRYEVMP